MSSTSLRTVEFFLQGEPGTLINVTETAEGTLDFRVRVIDIIGGPGDKPDIGDLRGLFFHVSDESLLGTLSIEGRDVTDLGIGANKVSNLKGGANMNGAGKPATPFDVGIEFGTQGDAKDDIRDTSFTLSSSSGPLSLDLVLDQYFGARLTSVSNNGEGRGSSLKLIGKLTEQPVPVNPPSGEPDPADTDPVKPDPVHPAPGGTYDDYIVAGDGNDSIYGGRGSDEIHGEGGDDLIVGGTDDGSLVWEDGLVVTVGDNLYGDDGKDLYLYAEGDGVDLIWDFKAGEDLIEVTGYGKDTIAGITYVRKVTNRIATPEHDKIALILSEDGDAIVFNDFPAPEDRDTAVVRFADGSTLSYAELLAAAGGNPIVEGSAGSDLPTPDDPTAIGSPATPLDLIGNNDDDTLIGGLGHDRLYGNEGVNALNGRAGNDELYGGNVRDILLGEDGDDIGYGNGGDDLIIGGAGSDRLYGAGGDDVIYGDDAPPDIELPPLLTTYVPAPAGEEVGAVIRIKKTWWGGFEGEITITARESIPEWGILLRSQFQIDSVWGAGIASETSWSKGIVYGLNSVDWNGMLSVGQTTTIGFTARAGVNGVVNAADLLPGLAIVSDASMAEPAAMRIAATLGNTLRGAAGADTLVGTKANDTFYVDHAKDKIVETSSGGSADRVVASVSYKLAKHVEHASAATGKARVDLTGNALANKIVGNSGLNKLNGGLGNDILTGGKGKDAFVFDTKLNKKSNVDRITDFDVKNDKIHLDNAIFKKLGKAGKLKKDYFAFDKAKDHNDYIIYNKKTGVLSYDADGSGSKKAVAFAKLNPKLKIDWGDFLVI